MTQQAGTPASTSGSGLIRSAIVFAIVLVVMTLTAWRGGGWPFLTMLVVFIATAVWWVVVDARAPAGGSRVAIALGSFAAAGILFAGFLAFHTDGLGVFAAIALYVGIGTLLSGLRASPTRAKWLGPALLVFFGGLCVVGLAAISPGMPKAALVAVIVGVLGLPLGVSLASEDALSWLADRSPVEGLGWALLGLAVFGGSVAVVLTTAAPRPLVISLAAVAFALLAAIVSNTQVDVMLVVTLLAVLVATAPRQQDPSERHSPPQSQPALLALGDSYMSGEGAESFFTGTNDDGRNECRRAPTAYAAEAVDEARAFPYIVFIACSGARAIHIYDKPAYDREPLDHRGDEGMYQLEQVRQFLEDDVTFPLVIVSIGGNDSGFSKIGMTCLAPGSCNDIGHLWLGNLSHVRTQVRAAYKQIRSTVGDDVPVLVVPYPTPLSPQGCGMTWLTGPEHKFLWQFSSDLNAMLRDEAKRAGFWFLSEMESALELKNLRLCDQGEELGVNFIGLSTVSGITEERLNPSNWPHNSLHPNAAGHDAMGDIFSQWLAVHPNPSPIPDTGPATTDGDAVAEAAADSFEQPCAITDAGDPGCDAQARDWALDETVRLLFPWGAIPLGGLVGIWAFWVGMLGSRRSRRLRNAAGSRVP